jgi:hypothetical protein
VVAPLVLLHPKLALGALLELLTLHEGEELVISGAVGARNLVLLAGLLAVPLAPAVETVLLLALGAHETRVVILLEEEHVLAVGSGAPRDGVAIHIGVVLEGVPLVLSELRLR